MVAVAVAVLFVSAAALAFITACSMVLRTRLELATRRIANYRPVASAQLAAYLVGTRNAPPPRPQGRFQQSVMRELLLSVGANVRGEAAGAVAALFRRYGLVEPARLNLNARRSLTRIRAAEALGAMGLHESVPWLRNGLRHEDRQLRFACARSLSALGAVSAVTEVDAALCPTQAELGQRIDLLVGFGAGAIPILIDDLRGRPDGRREWLAAEALGELRAASAVVPLSTALDSAGDELSARAARALGRIGDPRATDALARAAASERPWFVRAAAAGALGAIADPATAGVLLWALAGDQWDVRDAAARALVALDDAGVDAVAERLDVLGDEAVAQYLGTCDAAGVIEQIIARAAGGDLDRDELVRRGHSAGISAALERVAGDDDRAGRYAAAVLSSGRLALPLVEP
jgi:HEAT repeat protein